MTERQPKNASRRTRYAYFVFFLFCLVVPLAVFTRNALIIQAALVVGFVSGVLMGIFGIAAFRDAYQSRNWPRQEACLLESSLVRKYSSSSGTPSEYFVPKIKCFFTIDGKDYEGTEYNFRGTFQTRECAENKLAELEQMDPLMIYYKPEEPSMNVLYPGLGMVHFLRIIVGAMLIAFSTFYLDW